MNRSTLTLDDLQLWKNQIVTEIVKETVNQISKEISKQLTLLNLKPQNQMLKSSEVRKILNCSQSKLETLMRSGALPYVKVLGTNYFNKEDVENLFKNQYHTI